MNSDKTNQMAEKELTSKVFYENIESIVSSLTPENQCEISDKILSFIENRSQVPIIMNVIREKSKTNPTNVQEYIHIVTEIAMNLHLSKEPENTAESAGQPVITLVDESNVNRTLSTILEDDEEIIPKQAAYELVDEGNDASEEKVK